MGAGAAERSRLGKLTKLLDSPRSLLEIQITEPYHRPKSWTLWTRSIKNKRKNQTKQDQNQQQSLRILRVTYLDFCRWCDLDLHPYNLAIGHEGNRVWGMIQPSSSLFLKNQLQKQAPLTRVYLFLFIAK